MGTDTKHAQRFQHRAILGADCPQCVGMDRFLKFESVVTSFKLFIKYAFFHEPLAGEIKSECLTHHFLLVFDDEMKN